MWLVTHNQHNVNDRGRGQPLPGFFVVNAITPTSGPSKRILVCRHSMNATIVDLRYRMKDVLRAIDRGETVMVLYRGKVTAALTPVSAGHVR